MELHKLGKDELNMDNEEARDLKLAGTLLYSIREILYEAETLACNDDVVCQLIAKIIKDTKLCRSLCIAHASKLERSNQNESF